jgi:hypothetical protein
MMRVRALVAVLMLTLSGSAVAQGSWKVGDKVEAYNVDWYKATVIEIGTGSYNGYVRVHFDDFSSASDQYISLRNIRPRPGVQVSPDATGPRAGRYLIRSYANPTVPIPIGEFDLDANGQYTARANGGRELGTGRWSFGNGAVRFLSGPYSTAGWAGTFTIEREGRTHKIRLNGATIATNSR